VAERILARIPQNLKHAVFDPRKQVKGLYFNAKDDTCSFILQDGSQQVLASASSGLQTSGIDINDLAVALFVYCNEDITCKNISFSLDPVDERNPEGPFQKKVVWPDNQERRSLIEGTSFSEVMFEADWIMK
jgi:hypothetical protein